MIQSLSAILWLCLFCPWAHASDPSIARIWNEQLLGAIHNDTARPTIHARNLYHVSAAMYDAWAAYDDLATQVLHPERATAADIASARHEALCRLSTVAAPNRRRTGGNWFG